MSLFKRREPSPSLDWVRFDTTGYDPKVVPEPGRERVWFTPEGDGCGLYMFAVPPDLPRAAAIDDLRAFYAARVAAISGSLVEMSVIRAAGAAAVQLIATVSQPGSAFVGSVTIPYRDLSFVVKVQCAERGMTGIREAILFDRRLAEGHVPELRDGRVDLGDWSPHAAEFDAEFPDHPVSRARRFLERARSSLVIDPLLAAREPFPLPLPLRSEHATSDGQYRRSARTP